MAVLWDLNTGNALSVLRGHEAWVNDAVVFPTGSFGGEESTGEEASGKLPFPVHALTVGGDHMAVYWDGGTGKQLAVLEGHLDELTNVAVVGRGRFTVTSSLDGTARIWDLAASQ